MSKFLANENVLWEGVHLARQRGFDVMWIAESAPAADDETVLALSLAEGRDLVTFDKDFGDLAFRAGKRAHCGVILLRPRLKAPDYLAQFMFNVLEQDVRWEGNFTVAREGRLRVVPLPDHGVNGALGSP